MKTLHNVLILFTTPLLVFGAITRIWAPLNIYRLLVLTRLDKYADGKHDPQIRQGT